MLQRTLWVHGQMGFHSTLFFKFIFRSALALGFAFAAYSGQAQSSPKAGGADRTPKVNCDNITFPGKISGDQLLYKGDTPEPIYELESPAGGTGELRYLWMEYLQIGSLPAQWYPILSATSATYQPGPLNSPRKFMRCVTRAGCNTWIESNTVTITVTVPSF